MGKFAGAYVGARLQKVPVRQAGALATLMNTRGLTEVVILTIGLQLGILDDQLFSLMVVMALVTTAMAGPLLSLIYPRRWIERDVAEAEKAALGVTDAYRVFVAVPQRGTPTSLARLGADLVGGRRPAEVVLSRLLPYRTPELQAASGLSGELLDMTRAMEELARLAEPVRSPGVATPVLARFSADAGRDLAVQVTATRPDIVVTMREQSGHAALRDTVTGRLVTVTAPLPPSWDAVLVRTDGGADGAAAVQIGAQLAVARSVELVLDASGRSARRLAAVVAELNRHGVAARIGDDAPRTALVVVADGGGRPGHLLVRAERAPAPAIAAEWVTSLFPPPEPQGGVLPADGMLSRDLAGEARADSGAALAAQVRQE